MTPDRIRQLEPLVAAFTGWRDAVDADHPDCACEPVHGRWETSTACRRRLAGSDLLPAAAQPLCRTTTTIAVRVHMTRLRLPHTHLDDLALADAARALAELTTRMPELSDLEFARGMGSALGREAPPP